MMDMGIPNEKAELALSETGNVGVEVATEWLFSVPDHVLEKHLASEPNTPVEAAAQNPEDHRVMLPRRVPLQVSNHLCCCASSDLIHCLYSPWSSFLFLPSVSFHGPSLPTTLMASGLTSLFLLCIFVYTEA